MTLGDFLKSRRKELNWTQPEAAQRIQIEQSYLSKLESGKCQPSENVFDRLVEVYGIDTESLSSEIDPEEYEKLSDIKQIRQLVLSKKKGEISAFRGWMITGLTFLMLAGGFLAVSILYSSAQAEYHYRSQGVLKTGEPLQAFSIIEQPIEVEDLSRAREKQQMIDRMEQKDVISGFFKGESYVESVNGGKRYYELISQREASRQGLLNWFFVPGVMFLLGGIGCFFISYRWK